MSKEKETMTRFKITAALFLALAALGMIGASGAAAAEGTFGITPGTFDQVFENKDGTENLQAGAHPFSVTNRFEFDTVTDPSEPPTQITAGANPRKAYVDLYPGMIGDPFAGPRCSQAEFFELTLFNHCFDEAQIGIARVHVKGPFGGNEVMKAPLYNLEPSTGVPAEFGFWALIVPIKLTAEVRSDGDYGITIKADNVDQTISVIGANITFWGVPGDSAHDDERGGFYVGEGGPLLCGTAGQNPPCTYHGKPQAFLTTPMDCSHGPMETRLFAESWKGETDTDSTISHDDSGQPAGMTGCDRVPFEPELKAQPTTGAAETPTGLKATLEIPGDSIHAPKGLSQATVKKAVVKLPEGVTLNPSAGEGLGYCTPADFKRETLKAAPGSGCPDEAKIGSVRIDSPLLDEPALGSLYIGQADDPRTPTPGAENPFDSLVSLYVVARAQERGVIVRAQGKVEPDHVTGQLVTTFDNLPALQFSKFTLTFREGGRAPLATPRACGTYTSSAELTPYSTMSKDDIVTLAETFEVESGVGGGPCPAGDKAPWNPGLRAGMISNSAGTYSPFNVRLTRNDGEQEFTNFSIKLPPGVIGKLAGIPFCADSAIEIARQKSASEELEHPSCPAASEVGSTLVGAGVGSIITYVPGKVYLAGPYNGSALSIMAITAAKVGPFDIGTVVIRQALKINSETAEVFIDPTGSDPIPHIIDGIVVHARDIRVYIDRKEFTLNPTNCERTSTASTVVGSGFDFVNDADNNPLTVTSPFQAADCASLDFKPKLALSVSGATKRAGNPAFKAVLTMKPGEANVSRAQVTLPRTEFLDNAHIGTVCTRVQFRANECPAKSIYGRARAYTPILDTPVEGPVYLRSNPERSLPDLVPALASDKIEIDLVGRVDSVGKGRIRTTFEGVPDAPVSKFVLEMLGGEKGLLENSANLCAKTQKATVRFIGQNGKRHNFNPPMKAKCKNGKKRNK